MAPVGTDQHRNDIIHFAGSELTSKMSDTPTDGPPDNSQDVPLNNILNSLQS